jgi:predicted AlkP superfamily phosphohydrolase/phosphomutase
MYEPLREQIREILSNITDPATGRRAVREIHRREEIYRGPYVEKAADLLVEWESDAIEDSLGYSADGRSKIIKADEKDRTNKWKGNHRPLGILIASGPQIKHGERLAQASIYDIAPTILYLRGLAVPRDADGKVLTAIFTEERLSSCPVEWCEPASSEGDGDGARLNEEEAHQIEERLRGLGYIE